MIPSQLDPQTAIIIHASVRGTSRVINDERTLSEVVGLSMALGLKVSDARVIRLKKVTPATFLGGGLILSLQDELKELGAGLLVFDGELTPVQQRNLEERLQVKVLDRTGLILEIFSLRALTKEGRLQVELARIAYERSRLVRTWTHLERQRGGKGFLAGPGERQIESDRRELSDKAILLRKQLDKVRKTRNLHRKSRQKRNCPIIALVGYTNAGKSTLFNLLTDANVYVEDMLFATLDPTIREIKLDNQFSAVLSDTVGFISNLPTELIEAFRATLEEVTEADLILHVRDIASKDTNDQCNDVKNILSMLQEQNGKMPAVVEVWNKIDLLDTEIREFIEAKAKKRETPPVIISSQTGEGIEHLKQRLCDILQTDQRELKLVVPESDGQVLGWFQQNGRIISCDPLDTGDLSCVVRLDGLAYSKFCSAFPKLAAPAE